LCVPIACTVLGGYLSRPIFSGYSVFAFTFWSQLAVIYSMSEEESTGESSATVWFSEMVSSALIGAGR